MTEWPVHMVVVVVVVVVEGMVMATRPIYIKPVYCRLGEWTLLDLT